MQTSLQNHRTNPAQAGAVSAANYLTTAGRRAAIDLNSSDPDCHQLRIHQDADTVTIGWIGSQTTTAYLLSVLPVIESLNRTHQRVKLALVGAGPAISAPWIEHRPWSLATERSDLASFDIGIMPLPDTEWTRGKCGYKIRQYFAAGVPAIGSPVGVDRELIGQDRGMLATSAEEWHPAFECLIKDAQERRQRGATARDFVEHHYSYQRWAPELAAMLHSVA